MSCNGEKEYHATGWVTFEMEVWFDAPCNASESDLLDYAADALHDAPLQGLADIEVTGVEEVK